MTEDEGLRRPRALPLDPARGFAPSTPYWGLILCDLRAGVTGRVRSPRDTEKVTHYSGTKLLKVLGCEGVQGAIAKPSAASAEAYPCIIKDPFGEVINSKRVAFLLLYEDSLSRFATAPSRREPLFPRRGASFTRRDPRSENKCYALP